jgi:hypothetical protein
MTEDLGDTWIRCMRTGRFEDAWRISDLVVRSGPPPDASVPLHLRRVWDGTPLEGRAVLVRCHHGLGDTLQFARYLPMLESVVRRVIVWAPGALHPLLAGCLRSGLLLPLEDGEPEIDREVDIEIMELAHAFRTTMHTIPRQVPFLHVDDSQPTRSPFFRVGVAWRAGDWNSRRSLSLENVMTPAQVPGVQACCLHRELSDDERACGLLHDSRCATVFGTAQFMRSLDLVISVDSMPTHLAGALGLPVWTLLPTEPDWRWISDRKDSPWYPTMRLFHQATGGDWSSVMNDVRRELIALLRSHRSASAA